MSSKIETNVRVVPRGGCVKLVFDVEKNGRLTDEIKIASLQHLYFRFLLDIGDSGTHNILIREDYKTSGRLIVGIDLEENRKVEAKKSQLAHLFKKGPSKTQLALYEALVAEIKTLSPDDLDQDLLAKLGAVGIDLASVKRNIEIWESLKPVASADEKLRALPHSLPSEIDANADLVNEAFEKLKAIFLEHFHDAMIEAGQYIIDTFYDGNARLALAKNKSKDKPPSLKLLIEKLKQGPEGESGDAPSVSWFYKAVNLAAHEAVCKQMGLSSFTILGHSHKLQLLNSPKLKRIEGDKFDEAIEPAFREKERLAKHAHDNGLTVRAFKEYIDKEHPPENTNQIDLNDLPSREVLLGPGMNWFTYGKKQK